MPTKLPTKLPIAHLSDLNVVAAPSLISSVETFPRPEVGKVE
jgi:hypothetical protein